MSNLNIRGHVIQPQQIVRLDRFDAPRAVEAARKDGADNVFFKAGDDLYVASGDHMNLKNLKVQDTFEFLDKQAYITGVNNEANSFGEHLGTGAKWGVGAAGVAGLVSMTPLVKEAGLSGLSVAKVGSTLSQKGPWIAGAAIAVGALALGASYLLNKPAPEQMLRYGEELPPQS